MMPFTSADLLKQLHIVFESARNTFTNILKQLPIFIIRFLVYASPPFERDAVKCFWQRMGISVDFLEMVVDANIRWNGTSLLVDISVKAMNDLQAHIQTIMMCIFSWRKFVDARWLRTGVSCRGLVGSLFIGLARIVQMARTDPHTSEYKIHGFDNLTADVKKFACISSLVAFVGESALAEALEEERIVRILGAR
jgi:hypothetical protein